MVDRGQLNAQDYGLYILMKLDAMSARTIYTDSNSSVMSPVSRLSMIVIDIGQHGYVSSRQTTNGCDRCCTT